MDCRLITDKLPNPTVRAAIEALQRGDRSAWAALFERDAKLYDDGSPRSLEKFNQDAVGHERFTSIESVENNGLNLVGHFHSDQWGDFRPTSNFTFRRPARSSGWTSGRRASERVEASFQQIRSGGRMHTVIVLCGGAALLAACLLLGHAFGGSMQGLALGAKAFIPLWFVLAAVNMWIGVSRAGYSVADEAPVFLVIFIVPAALAALAWWKFG